MKNYINHLENNSTIYTLHHSFNIRFNLKIEKLKLTRLFLKTMRIGKNKLCAYGGFSSIFLTLIFTFYVMKVRKSRKKSKHFSHFSGRIRNVIELIKKVTHEIIISSRRAGSTLQKQSLLYKTQKKLKANFDDIGFCYRGFIRYTNKN
jgi:hypothetical protein